MNTDTPISIAMSLADWCIVRDMYDAALCDRGNWLDNAAPGEIDDPEAEAAILDDAARVFYALNDAIINATPKENPMNTSSVDPEFLVKIRDARMRIVAASEGLDALLGWSNTRPLERIDIWPGRGTGMCQAGFTWEDGSTCIFDHEQEKLLAWLKQVNEHRQWPEPMVHERKAS